MTDNDELRIKKLYADAAAVQIIGIIRSVEVYCEIPGVAATLLKRLWEVFDEADTKRGAQ